MIMNAYDTDRSFSVGFMVSSLIQISARATINKPKDADKG